MVQAAAKIGHRGNPFVRVPGVQDVRPPGDLEHDGPFDELHLLHRARYSPRGVTLGSAGRRHAHHVG